MENKDLLKIAELNIKKSIEEVFEPGNFLDYVRVVSAFPQYGYKNHLLIYKQNKKCRYLLSKKRAIKKGIEIKNNQIVIIYPGFLIDEESKRYMSKYETGIMYEADLENVESLYAPDKRKEIDLYEKIRKNMIDYSIREAYEGELKSGNGYIDYEKKHLIIRPNISREETLRVVSSLYIEAELRCEEESEIIDIAKEILTIMIFDYFRILPASKEKAENYIFLAQLKDKDETFKEDLLKMVSDKASQIIMDLTRYTLTIEEICILNNLLRTNKKEEVIRILNEVRREIEDIELKEKIEVLTQKVKVSKDSFIVRLNTKVKNKELYLYPETELKLKEIEELKGG